MGNIECCGDRKIRESSFSESEKIYLQNLYNNLLASNKATAKAKFNKDTLKTLFAENPEIAEGVYDFMVHISGDKSKVDSKSFEFVGIKMSWKTVIRHIVEALTKDPAVIQLKDFRDREKVDMLALLIIKDFTLSRDQLKTIKANYKQAIEYVKCLLAILNCDNKGNKSPDFAAKVVVEGSFKGKSDEVNWSTFLQYIKDNLIFANSLLKAYFNMKFLGTKANLKVPELSKTSSLLKDGLLSLLYFSNFLMQNTPKLHYIYGSSYKELSFKRICQSLENSDVPTYIIMKVIPIEEGQGQGDCKNYDDEEGFIIGGFSQIPWKNTGEYRGDRNGHVFSLAPKFKNCFALTKATANNNYIYMKTNTDTSPAGMGFGGTTQNDFRIWIDGSDFDKSYVRNEDSTYSAGNLVEPSSSYVKILELEIWGISVNLLNAESTSPLNKSSNTPSNSSGTWITFNQSKISELMEFANYQKSNAKDSKLTTPKNTNLTSKNGEGREMQIKPKKGSSPSAEEAPNGMSTQKKSE